ncbi:cytochrome P450 [Gloeothece citriformis PCC 7424]|uniref:Cytochrome P450 n=1 Tax=Gloeothece citriformis (strain PCC 7424) TaxID=65393 RepID=B7KH25_GLOC7|nr:cytochrome P450 [Gloeothece citriformis]ACK73512.1 cytochrome P450 [Gloeothece citriformis PCC 7424]
MTFPPRPTEPQLLRTLKLLFRPTDYLDDYGKRFGDCFAIGSSERGFVYINHPTAIQKIFTAPAEQFESGRGNGVLRFLLGDNSLVLLDGESHQRQRKLLMPPFHGERLRTYQHLICEITQQVTEQLTVGKTFRVRPIMQEITLRVILQAVFGLTEGDRYAKLRGLLTTVLDSVSSPISSSLLFFRFLQKDWGPLSPWGRFLRLKAEVDQLLCDEIQERQKQEKLDGDDILTLLLSARDENGEPMTLLELRDELMTLLVAGHETTASALTWAFYWVHSLPEVQDKLRFELSNLGDNPDLSEISRLPYLNAVCLETLRIYPVAVMAFARILKSEMELLGYKFRANTALGPCIYLLHRREDLYPEADKFKPERFLERQYSPYEFIPFGGGNRRCIGMALAMLEMKLVLASILSNFQLELINSRPLKPVRRGLTLAAPNSFKMRVSSRH